MLTPDYYEHCTDEIMALYGELDSAITRDIVRRIVKTGVITESAKLQLILAQQSGMLYDDVIKTISKHTKKSEKEIKRLFAEAGIQSYTYDNKIYEQHGLEPLPLNLSPSAVNVLAAGVTKTSGFLNNLTRTTALQAQQSYIRAVTLAEMQVESGAFDYATAIKNAVRTVISEGSTVKYPSGHIDKLDVAVRRAVLTGVSQTVGEISLAHAKDMGCDLMEITAHSGARPSHAEWQGKIVSLSGRPGYLTLADIGYGTGEGFKGWNCRHDWHPFFEDSIKSYTDEELQNYKDKTVEYNGKTMSEYDATQRQRAMERAIRKSKRELAGYDEAIKNVGDNEALRKEFQTNFERASVKLKQQESKYKEFSYAVNQRPDNVRTQVQGFDKSISQKAVWANKKSVAKSGESGILSTETANGLQVKSVSVHTLERAAERGVTSNDIVDSLQKPLHIGGVVTDDFGRNSQRFIGDKVTVNVNPDSGKVTTVWKTGKATRKKYLKKGD